jgi:hypothetical protein
MPARLPGRAAGQARPAGCAGASLCGGCVVARAGRDGADECGDVFGGFAVELGQDAGVGVGGDGDGGGQAEGFPDDFHVVPGGQQQGGAP